MKYNPSIDGLRTLAILPVLIFHLNERWLSGGFLGVDIFFTISGFLITTILLREYESKTFSYYDFYKRRIKRILPAYFFLLAGVTVAAAIIMLPYDFYKYSISAVSSIFFISNLGFALRTDDYFSNDASQWPLLHTWSLSVEEQFYIFWPIILGFIFAIKSPIEKIKTRLFYVILCFITVSIILATLLSSDAGLAKWNYYLVVTRASELLIGALLAVLIAKGQFSGFSQKTTFPALIVLVLCFIFYDKSMPFPSYWVLPPCLATLVILGGSREGYVYKFLSLKPVVKIGLLSYSLYLWHWPIIAFTRYIYDVGGDTTFEIGVAQAIPIVLLSFFMSLVSYHFIENPFRFKKWSFGRAFTSAFAIPAAIGVTFFIGAIFSNGYPERVKSMSVNPLHAYFSINKERCPHLLNLGCQGGDKESELRYLLVGNSHAEHYFEFYHVLAENLGIGIDLAAGGGCGITRSSTKCQSIYKYALDNFDKYDGFILAANWGSGSFDENSASRIAYDNFVSKLQLSGKPIFIAGRVPEYSVDIDKIINYKRLFGADNPDFKVNKRTDTDSINMKVEQYAHHTGMQFVNIYKNLKTSGYIFSIVDSDGAPLYLDSHHLSVYGAASMAKFLLSASSKSDLRKYYFGVEFAAKN